MVTSVFHRIWFGDNPIPQSYENYWSAWQRQFPEAEFITWTEANIDDLPLCRDKLKTMTSHAARADLARYEILFTLGGIYLDCDVMPYQHFSIEEMTQTLTVCNETDSHEYCSIGFIAAPAHHPIFRELITHILSNDIDESRPNVTTGPWLFGAFIKRHAHRRLPPSAFYPYLYDEPLSILRRRDLGNTFGIHVWGGSWLTPKQRQEKAFQLLHKGDISESARIVSGYSDEWSEDVKVLIESLREIRIKSVEVAQVFNQNMSIAKEEQIAFDFAKIAAWLLEQDNGLMVWQIGAADGMLVDPLRPVMISYDPPAVLMEPNPWMFEALQRGYRNNRNATLLPIAYGTGETELILNAVNPIKVEQAGLPRWVLGISSIYDDKNALGGKTIDHEMTMRIQACVEKITVQAIPFDEVLSASKGRLPDILVVDAEGMDKIIIDDILNRQHLPMLIHFEVQCLEPLEQRQLLASLEANYVLLQFGNDITAYRRDILLDYARVLYVDHGIPTLFRQGLNRLNGL